MARIGINLKSGNVAKTNDTIIGIDLGTTNSLVAYIKDGQAEAVTDKSGKNTLVPSIIHFAESGAVIVGEEAKSYLIKQPERTIYSAKRLMGKSYKDLESHDDFFTYKIIDDDTESLVKVRVGDKFYTPIELSSFILKNLKHRIEKELGGTISKAVITVPAYFNDAQRQATRDAGKLAGLDVLRIVNEPTAASLAYGLGKEEEQTVAVYDLGGGTFDISILQIQDGVFEVLSTNGNTYLGGDDFDKAIMKYWIKEKSISENKLKEDKAFSQALRLLAEEAKKSLSKSMTFTGEIQGGHYQITKSQFEAEILPLVDKTIASCQIALKDADLSTAEIDNVVMVGGSTRVPLVQKAVSEFFGQALFNDLDPDEVVALGAAIQADVLAGNQKEVLLLDVTPLSLGIETVGGLMDTIIPRNSKVPNKAGRQYTTSVDGQKNLKISVYQGERDLVEHNRKLGEFILRGIPPMAAGIPKIEIHFILNADGILKVRAKELRSNIEQTVDMKPSYGLSEAEMGKMLLESIQNAEADMKMRGLLEARNEAKNIILSSEKFIVQNQSILTKEEVETTIGLTENLKKMVEASDKDAINKAMDELNEYTTPLAHRAMDATIAESIKGKKI